MLNKTLDSYATRKEENSETFLIYIYLHEMVDGQTKIENSPRQYKQLHYKKLESGCLATLCIYIIRETHLSEPLFWECRNRFQIVNLFKEQPNTYTYNTG